MIRKTFLTLLTLTTFNALGAGYTGPGTITGVSSMFPNGNFEIYGTGWNNPDNCSSTAKWRGGLHSTDNSRSQDSKHAIALSAYLSGKTVEFYIDGCQDGFPVIKSVFSPQRNN